MRMWFRRAAFAIALVLIVTSLWRFAWGGPPEVSGIPILKQSVWNGELWLIQEGPYFREWRFYRRSALGRLSQVAAGNGPMWTAEGGSAPLALTLAPVDHEGREYVWVGDVRDPMIRAFQVQDGSEVFEAAISTGPFAVPYRGHSATVDVRFLDSSRAVVWSTTWVLP